MTDLRASHGVLKLLSYLDLFLKHQVPAILPWYLLAAQCWHESSFCPMAVSPAGALGMAQFMPATWAEVGEGSPFCPDNAVKAQSKYMLEIAMLFAETDKTGACWWVAAYTWGPNRTLKVESWDDVPESVKQHCYKVIETAKYYHDLFQL